MKKILITSVLTESFYKSRIELINQIIYEGNKVILVGPEEDSQLFNFFDKTKVEFHQLFLNRTSMNPFHDLKTIFQLYRIIKEVKPDVVYAFGGAKASIYSLLSGKMNNVENMYVTINGLGSIYRNDSLQMKIARKYMDFLYKRSLKSASGVMFQNSDDLNVFIKRGLVDLEKTKLINGSGVNLKKYKYTVSPKSEQTVFLFIGRILKDKGIKEYISAAQLMKEKHENVEFWVVGPLDTNPSAIGKEKVLEWESKGIIKYFGKQEKVYDFYRNSHVFVLPSYHEGMPRTILEAMATGKAIITTNAPGCRDTVIQDVNGYITNVGDHVGLYLYMSYFVSQKKQLAVKGLNSRKMAEKYFDVNIINREILDFILQ